MTPRLLVVAKAPVPGQVKTRLGADIGMEAAAEIAAASLLDSLIACADAVGPARCHLSLAGELRDGVRGDQLARFVSGWAVHHQHGANFAERLVNAHLDLPSGAGSVVQIGMDTPQVTPGLLLGAADSLADPDAEGDPEADAHDAVLGPADDGGWWVLALRDPRHATALVGVSMSTPTTYDDTRRALLESGLKVGSTTALRDVDTVADADAVAVGSPNGHFAHAWHSRQESPRGVAR